MTYEEKVQFLFKRFTYKVTQTATTQEWYKNDMPQMESWEQDGCVYMLTQGPPKGLCVRNDSDAPKNIKDSYILQPGESFSTQDQGWINTLVNKPSIFQKTAISDAIALAAEELKGAAECQHCGKVLNIGDSVTCPHGEELQASCSNCGEVLKPENNFQCPHGPDLNYQPLGFGTMIPAKAGKTVVYATKQISPVEKPKGRFIKLK